MLQKIGGQPRQQLNFLMILEGVSLKNWWAAKATAQFFINKFIDINLFLKKVPLLKKSPYSVSPAHVGYCFFLPAHVCLCCFQSAF